MGPLARQTSNGGNYARSTFLPDVYVLRDARQTTQGLASNQHPVIINNPIQADPPDKHDVSSKGRAEGPTNSLHSTSSFGPTTLQVQLTSILLHRDWSFPSRTLDVPQVVGGLTLTYRYMRDVLGTLRKRCQTSFNLLQHGENCPDRTLQSD